jgi:hypothetical protein
MAEAVVSGAAQVLATLAVIVRLTGHPVFKFQCRIFRTVHVFRPLVAHVQPPLSGQPAHQHCNNNKLREDVVHNV